MKLQNEPFDEEERSLMEAVESGQSVQVSGDELTSISLAIHTPSAKTISLRVNEADLEGIKNRAAGAGIPYQTLINSVLHRYLTGDVVLKTQL